MNEDEGLKEYAGGGLSDQEKLIRYTTDDLVVTPDRVEVVLTAVEETTFTLKNGDEKPSLKAYFENAHYGLRFSEFFSKPAPDSKVSDRSKLGRFIKRYGEFSVGVQCVAERTPNGYYKIVL